MSVDVFGRTRSRKGGGKRGERGPPGIGFKLTEDGQFDLENKRLCNVAYPEQPKDAVILSQLEYNLKDQRNEIDEEIQKKYQEGKSEIDELRKSIDELKNSRNSMFDSIDYFKNTIGIFKGEIYQEIKAIKEKLGIEEKKPDTLLGTAYRHKKVVSEKSV